MSMPSSFNKPRSNTMPITCSDPSRSYGASEKMMSNCLVRATDAKNMIRVEFDKEYWHNNKKVGDEIYLELDAKHLFLLRD